MAQLCENPAGNADVLTLAGRNILGEMSWENWVPSRTGLL